MHTRFIIGFILFFSHIYTRVIGFPAICSFSLVKVLTYGAKIIGICVYSCNALQLNCVSLTKAVHDRENSLTVHS